LSRFSDKGIALSPYKIAADAGSDIAINCMQNTSVSNGSHIVLHHVTKDGVSNTIVDGGKIVTGNLTKRYDFVSRDNGDGILHNIVTLKCNYIFFSEKNTCSIESFYH
jgi:hypothetical protein